jgi:hypothetical protein
MPVPKFFSRCLLFVINIIVLGLAGLMLYFGVVGESAFDLHAGATGRAGSSPSTSIYINSTDQNTTHTTNGGDSINYVLNPFRTCIFIASFMMISSLLGLCTAFSYKGKYKTNCSKCALFFHLIISFVGLACLVYASAFVLMFASDADDIIIIFWKFTSNTLPSSMTKEEAVVWFHSHLQGAAGVLIFSSVLIFVCIICDSHLLGHELTARRIVISTNIITFILGVLLIVVSFMNVFILGHDDIILPYIAGSVGMIVLIISLIGILSVCKNRSYKLSCCYAFLMMILTIVLIVIASITFQKRAQVQSFVNENWNTIEKKLIGVDTITKDDFIRQLHQHFNLIGISSSIMICMLLLNTVASTYFWCSQRKKTRDYDASERRELFDDSSDEEDLFEEGDSASSDDGDDGDDGNGKNQRDIEMASQIKSKKKHQKRRGKPTSM